MLIDSSLVYFPLGWFLPYANILSTLLAICATFLELAFIPSRVLAFSFSNSSDENNGFNAPSAIISNILGKNLDSDDAKAPPAFIFREAPRKSISSM